MARLRFEEKNPIAFCSLFCSIWIEPFFVACDFRELHKKSQIKIVKSGYVRGWPKYSVTQIWSLKILGVNWEEPFMMMWWHKILEQKGALWKPTKPTFRDSLCTLLWIQNIYCIPCGRLIQCKFRVTYCLNEMFVHESLSADLVSRTDHFFPHPQCYLCRSI